jgi:hypothetical protein
MTMHKRDDDGDVWKKIEEIEVRIARVIDGENVTHSIMALLEVLVETLAFLDDPQSRRIVAEQIKRSIPDMLADADRRAKFLAELERTETLQRTGTVGSA